MLEVAIAALDAARSGEESEAAAAPRVADPPHEIRTPPPRFRGGPGEAGA
jgi:hypothetical protein